MQIIRMIILIFSVTFFIGCGGGSSSDNTKVETPIENTDIPLNTQNFNIDESDFADTSNFQKIDGISNNPKVELKNKDNNDSLDIGSGDIINNTRSTTELLDMYVYETTLSKEIVEQKIGQQLYIDGDFAGIIKAYENGSIIVEDAQSIAEVYPRFDIEATNDKIAEAVTRSIKKSVGKYDYLNKNPLKISFVQKDVVTKNRSILKNEPVIVIEFPEGYTVPLRNVRKTTIDANVNCELSEAMCDADFNYDSKKEWDVDKEKTFGSVTFSTKGSKIEIGLGAYIRAMYDYETVGSDQYYFEFKPSVYYLVDVKMTMNGKSITGDEKTFDIVENGLDIKIPLHKVVFLNLNVKPEIVLKMDDAKNNENLSFEATLKSKRTGYVRLTYSNGNGNAKVGIEEDNEPLTKASISLKVDTGKDKIVGSVFPEIAVRPQLSFKKISKKINIAYVRNGAVVETRIKGVIDENWIVENTEVSGSSVEDVYLKTVLFGLVDFKWDIKVGDLDIYSSDDWTSLYKTDEMKILEWMSQLLQEPTIIVEASNDKRFVSFDIESGLKEYIRFYYTTDGTDIDDTKIINDSRDNTPYKIWRDGDKKLEFSEDKTIKVRAVVFTDEISTKDDTLWRWGMSLSKQAKEQAIYLPAPSLSPLAKDFKASMKVIATQDKNDEIKYSDNGGISFISCGFGTCNINVDTSLSLHVKAVRTIDDIEYSSNIVVGSYRECQENEDLSDGGACVTKCPYLWDVIYTQSHLLYTEGGSSPEEWAWTSGTTQFLNVFIAPRCEINLYSFTLEDGKVITDSELYDSCKPYFDNTKSFSTYEYNDNAKSENNNLNKDPASFYYAGAYGETGSALCSRDPEGINDVALEELEYKNLPPNKEDEVYPRVEGNGEVFYGTEVEEDIFAEIYDRKTFSVTQANKGKFTFIPREYKKIVYSSSSSSSISSSSSSSSSSVDNQNQSDNDEDNGVNVDGSYNEQNGSLWKFHVDYSSDLGSGSMDVIKFPIELSNMYATDYGSDIVFVGNDYQSYPENTTLSYSGLEYDDGLSPLLVYYDSYFKKHVVEFSAFIYAFGNPEPYQIGSSSYAISTDCDGTLPSDFQSKVEKGESIEWSVSNYGTTCSYKFEACKNEECN